MSAALARHEGSRLYNLARARGRAPGEILARCTWALGFARRDATRAILGTMADRAAREVR